MPDDAIVDITAAEQVAAYKLKLSFSDGAERIVDFEPFLASSTNPLIRHYLEARHFASFRVEDGDLVWDDFGLCFSVADLYENRI